MLDFKNKSKLLTPIVTSNLSIILGKTKILDQINCKIKKYGKEEITKGI